MIKLHKLIATALGIGYVGKGGGTIAAAVCCIIWVIMPVSNSTIYSQVLMTILISALGVWSGNAVDAIWGKDSSKVVIDEVAGMMITLLLIPVQLKYVLAGLVLFRFFDIAKPFFIRKMELLPKGWGVMADDILAGIYANILLQIIVVYKIL
ncbi:phosphatidylglycerophosphatase A family protein [Segetibacter koreensis]|uniref:phosphatidylglycerophosphatase A family protein n=1 Tax=Segetibacter koreensis TaxID=398037 RepID=UPI00037045E9|nr:phosphatidylglycerophosphatase A [Segetibacter koreensis]